MSGHKADFMALPMGAVVVVDSAPIIYLLEDNSHYLPRFMPLFQRIEAYELKAVISTITLAELLAGPLKQGKHYLAQQYSEFFATHPNWRTQNFTPELALLAAEVRVRCRLKLPDAIQVATALHHKAAALVTHDRDFHTVDDVQIIGACI